MTISETLASYLCKAWHIVKCSLSVQYMKDEVLYMVGFKCGLSQRRKVGFTEIAQITMAV